MLFFMTHEPYFHAMIFRAPNSGPGNQDIKPQKSFRINEASKFSLHVKLTHMLVEKLKKELILLIAQFICNYICFSIKLKLKSRCHCVIQEWKKRKVSLHDFRVNILVTDTHMYVYEWTSITWFILDGIYRQKTAPFLDVKSLETHP